MALIPNSAVFAFTRHSMARCRHTGSRIKSLLIQSNTASQDCRTNHQMMMSTETTKTQYTIDDSVCLPTEPKTLQKIVSKHIQTVNHYLSCKPLAQHTLQAFEETQAFIGNDNKSIILDSGCGTGKSTIQLGKQFPDAIILGIDKSLHRLQRNSPFGSSSEDTVTCPVPNMPNILFIRAELADFWQLCLKNKNVFKIDRHYLLYPNPYPKKARLKHRWYAHPSFPLLVQLGGHLILRSNWETYLNEFQTSLQLCHDNDTTSTTTVNINNIGKHYLNQHNQQLNGNVQQLYYDESFVPMTNFEAKYVACGEPIYELVIRDNTMLDSI